MKNWKRHLIMGTIVGILLYLGQFSASTEITRSGGSLFEGTSKWQLEHAETSGTKYGG